MYVQPVMNIVDLAERDVMWRALLTQHLVEALNAIFDQQALLERNPLLARNIRNRCPYIIRRNDVQLERLKCYRNGDADERVVQGLHLTINGIAAGLRNSG